MNYSRETNNRRKKASAIHQEIREPKQKKKQNFLSTLLIHIPCFNNLWDRH